MTKPRQANHDQVQPMTMTFKQRVQDARNINEALIAVAEGIDLILDNQAMEFSGPAPALDPWSEWAAAPAEPRDDERARRKQWLRDRIAVTVGQERAGHEAELRLLEDEGKTIDRELPDGVRDIVRVGEDAIEVECRPVDAARRHERAAFAYHTLKLGPDLTPPLDPMDACEAYVKGGPSWLYVYDRDFVVSLPAEFKGRMVDDVEQDSPREAAEMGRDILKDETGLTQEQQFQR